MKKYEHYLDTVNQSLSSMVDSIPGIPGKLREAMLYSLEAGGKRIRPVMLLAACDMAGGKAEEALPFACALEMIHTYSLIHDDLPAMDNDDLRRGKPTNHIMFGEDMAVLAGDGLLNAAAEIMTRAALGFPDLRGLRAMEAILRHAGVSGMIAGQTADVTGEGQMPTEEQVRYIHCHKTGDLLQAPMEAGLILAGAEEAIIRQGSDYGLHFGLAFQMTDDLLDVLGDAKVLGKNTGLDAAAGKMTWVALRGVEGTRQDAEEQVRLAEESLEKTGLEHGFFTRLAQDLLTRVC